MNVKSQFVVGSKAVETDILTDKFLVQSVKGLPEAGQVIESVDLQPESLVASSQKSFLDGVNNYGELTMTESAIEAYAQSETAEGVKRSVRTVINHETKVITVYVNDELTGIVTTAGLVID